MINYFIRFQAINQDKVNRLTSRIKDIDEEMDDIWQKRDEAEKNRAKFRKALKVYIIEAQDLVPLGLLGTADPYCVVYFGNQNSKSATANNTLQPIWNELFTLYF